MHLSAGPAGVWLRPETHVEGSDEKSPATNGRRGHGQPHGPQHQTEGSGEAMELKNNKRLKFTGLWIIMLSLFLGELFFYTWCRVNNVRLGYEVARETEKQTKLLAYQENLKIENRSVCFASRFFEPSPSL